MPGYDAFISYSHAADARLAPALQRALQRFAKPWWKLRALNLFRDETSLAAASSLSAALLKALDTSRYFILLASPRAAASRWCNEEVAHWLRHRSADTLLIVLTEGAVAWDDAGRDFDWSHTDALPPALKGAFAAEPFWLDLSWARNSEQVSERDPRFQQVVAKLAATLHGSSLEDISGEEVRQHRLTRRVAAGAVAAIAALAIGAGVAAWEATRARHDADRQRAAAQKSEQEAKTQRDAAERALEQTLEAVDTLVLEIGQGMKDFAGVPRARLRGVLERAEKILDALPANSDSAALQGRQMNMSLVLADALLVLGDTAQALRRATTATDIARRQSALMPQDTDWQRELATCLDKLGDVRQAQGDLAGALQSYEAGRIVMERLATSDPANADWQHGLSVSLSRVGDIRRAQGDLSGALQAYEASRAIIERLAKSDPGNAGWQRDLSVSLDKMGGIREAQGDLTGALQSYEASLTIIERLAKSEPGEAGWQRDLSASLNNVGAIRRAQGDLAGALQSFEASRAIIERLARSDPGNAGWQGDLAASLEGMGNVRQAQGDLAGALQSFEACQVIMERMAKSDPANAGWQRNLATSLSRVGSVRRALGDLAAALQSYEASLAVMERLAAIDPGNADWQRDLAASLSAVGNVRQAQGDLAGALQSYEANRAIRERLATIDPSNAGWQFDLFVSSARLAAAMEHLPGRLAQSREWWRRAVEIVDGLAATNRLAPSNLSSVEAAKKHLAAVEARLATGER